MQRTMVGLGYPPERARELARRKKEDSPQLRIPPPIQAGHRGALPLEVSVQFQIPILVFQEDGPNSQSAHGDWQ